MTLRKDRTKDELLESLKDLDIAANLLTDVTQKLISSARISYESIPRSEPIDLSQFFESQIKMFQTRADQRGIQLRIEPSEKLRVHATRALLNEVFGNLIENAIVYSNSGGYE